MVNPVRSYWVPGGPEIYGSDYKSEPAREIKEMRCYINRKEDKKMKRYLISVTVLVFVISFAGFSRAEEPSKEFKDPLTNMEFIFVKGGCFQMGDTFGDGVVMKTCS